MMRLAVLADSEAVTTQAVADAVDAPRSHAAKIVTRLRDLGVVEVQRGRRGGLRLTPGGHTGSLGALVRTLEGEGDVAGCAEGTPCPLRHACRLRTALRDAQEAFYAALDPLTIDDLTTEPSRQALLSLSLPARLPFRPQKRGPRRGTRRMHDTTMEVTACCPKMPPAPTTPPT